MRVLVLGATGYVGRHIAVRLKADGHAVSALIRSSGAADRMAADGVRPITGDLLAGPDYTALLREHDAVIWAAQLMLEDEERVVGDFLREMAGSDKAFVFTGGTSLLSEPTNGEWSENSYAEDDTFVPRRQVAPRLAIEQLVRKAAGSGVRAMCIRPPLIWGNGGSRIISDLYHSARATGAVCYVGRGLNLYTNVHVEDLASVYALALERGVAGALYHAVAGEVNFRTLAEAVARHLAVPTRSIDVAEAMRVWDPFMGKIVFPSCSRTRAPRARSELNWRPSEIGLDILEDCGNPIYRNETDRALPSWVRPVQPA